MKKRKFAKKGGAPKAQGAAPRPVEPASGQKTAARLTGCRGKYCFCQPVDRRMRCRFRLPASAMRQSPQGSLLLLEPEKRISGRLWSARLIKAYGPENRVDVQERLVKLNHEVPADFPPGVLDEAAACPQELADADLAGRQDLRHLPFVTIDGSDARDFDDAIHVERQGQGWLLRVAIADVSHYVRPRPGKKDSLDSEALRRGNSWYFPASVEPMLPFALSNHLCSLKPHEDRLVMLVEIAFNAGGRPVRSSFAPALMRSAARLTYEGAQALHQGQEPEPEMAVAGVPQALAEAFRLYDALRRRREERGALDFELPEATYGVRQDGTLGELGRRERTDAHRLIEEFMIAANEAVAAFLAQSGVAFPYRVHPAPDGEALLGLAGALAAAAPEFLPGGFRPEADASQLPIKAILEAARGSEKEFTINRLCLRAMSQARYQAENEGHFGLASPAYCHFTSPIRRYADLLVHRALKHALGCDAGTVPAGKKLMQVTDQLNRREREAVECEREMARRMGCVYLAEKTGEEFGGTVSAVLSFGAFVQLDDLPVEGLIRARDLGPAWRYDPESSRLQGPGCALQLGTRLKTRLARVDPGRLDVLLTPLDLPGAGAEARSRRRSGRREPPARRRPPRKRSRG